METFVLSVGITTNQESHGSKTEIASCSSSTDNNIENGKQNAILKRTSHKQHFETQETSASIIYKRFAASCSDKTVGLNKNAKKNTCEELKTRKLQLEIQQLQQAIKKH